MASKIKSKPPKQSEMTPDLPSDDLQLLSENNPPENNPGPSKKSLHGRRKRYMHSVSKTIYNIEQKINHFLKLQHEQRQEIYQEHSHQFLNLVVMWNIDADEVKKHGENLFNILDQQQELFHQFQVIHKQKIEEFKELCNRHLKNLQAIKSCRRKAILEESRNQMDLLERKLTTETVKLQEEKAGVRSSLLSLLFS